LSIKSIYIVKKIPSERRGPGTKQVRSGRTPSWSDCSRWAPGPVDVGQTGTESWHVLADPEGNEFCLLHTRLERRERERLRATVPRGTSGDISDGPWAAVDRGYRAIPEIRMTQAKIRSSTLSGLDAHAVT
jgi:hypothetical protein